MSSAGVRLTVPHIGTRLTLTRGWVFTLHTERRNSDFAQRMGIKDKDGHWRGDSAKVSLPSGTVLVVDRIYIRQGAADFDSISFRLKKGDHPDKKVWGRFWVKLGDANRIHCEWDMETVKVADQDAITALGELSL